MSKVGNFAIFSTTAYQISLIFLWDGRRQQWALFVYDVIFGKFLIEGGKGMMCQK